MKKGTFVEIIGTDLIIVMLFVVPLMVDHYDLMANVRTDFLAFLYAGPVVTALVGFMAGIVKRIPIFTAIAALVAGLASACFMQCAWWLCIIPVVAIFIGYLIGYIVREAST